MSQATPFTMPRLCLGTMTFGQQNTEAQAHEQLDYARDHGIHFIDTAEMYPLPVRAETKGATETIIGRWLRHQPRDQVLLATKVAGPGRGMAWIRTGERAEVPELSRRDIILACEESLRRLQTDYIDLYQIHWPARNVGLFGQAWNPALERESTAIQEQLEAMDQLVRDGKIRHVGVSNETAWGVCEFTHLAQRWGLPRIVSLQNVFNLMSREYEGGLQEACAREKVGLLAYSVLAFGYLTGKYAGGQQPETARITLFGKLWPRYQKAGIPPAVDAYLEIARRFGLTPVQLALGWMAQHPGVASIILGATSVAQLRECIEACDTKLPPEALQAIQEQHLRQPNPAP